MTATGGMLNGFTGTVIAMTDSLSNRDELNAERSHDGEIDWDHPVKFLWLIGLIDRGVQRSLQERLRPHELSLPEYSTLSVLHWAPGLSNAELARRALVTPQSMNEVVARLERRGLIERERHPEHGRILMTEVTEEGRRLVLAALASLGEFENELLGGLPDADVEAAKELLRLVLDRLQQP